MTNAKQMQRLWAQMGVDVLIVEQPNYIKLCRFVVDKNMRNMGFGSLFMNALTNYADEKNKRIDLRPSLDFGGTSIDRLKRFYKRFGFVENVGPDRIDISETMYRHPPIMKWGKF